MSTEAGTAQAPSGHVPMTSPPVPGAIMYVQPPLTYTNYAAKQSLGLGVVQVVLGVLCIFFNAVALGLASTDGRIGYDVGFVGHGFWCGVLFIFTGAFGIAASTLKTKCKIITYMVLCIISACFTSALLIVGFLGAVCSSFFGGYNDCYYNYYYDYGYDYNYRYYYQPPCRSYSYFYTVAAMEGCMAASGFIAAVLFIWGSTLCCKAMSCCKTCCRSCCGSGCGSCCGSCCCCCCNEPTPQMTYMPNGGLVLQGAVHQMPMMPYQPGVVAAPPPYQANYPMLQLTNLQGMPVAAAAATTVPLSFAPPPNCGDNFADQNPSK